MAVYLQEIIYRSASVADIELLTALHEQGFANYWDTSAFNDFFAVAGTGAFVAEDTDKNGKNTAIGMVVVRVSHDQADIITIVVIPAYRRLGIARILMEKAMAEALKMGATQMFLDVEDGNNAALRLYENLGFTLLNRRKLYYRQKNGSYTDALVMKCKLA